MHNWPSRSSGWPVVPIDPGHFLELARDLRGARPIAAESEPCLRTVAGRAYYAAFLATQDVIRAAYGDPNFEVDHRPLANELQRAGGDVARVGLKLNSMRSARNRADYRPAESFSDVTAEAALRDAQSVLQLLPTIASRIPAGIPRKQR